MTSLLAKDLEHSTLPIISLAGLRTGDPNDLARVAAEIRAACVDQGFFYVCDHGIPESLTADIIAQARRFFALPLAAKLDVDRSKSIARRGYEAMGAQTLEAGAPADLKESFTIDRDLPLDDPAVLAGAFSCGPNQWPDDLPGWRESLETYRNAMLELCNLMTRAIEASLDLEPFALAGFCDEPSAMLRLVHYPPQPANPAPGEKGCGAHTDWGAFTFLLQDDAGGLQVLDQREGWVHAAPIPGTFVVNVGDMLARWTNDRYTSTMHRVVNVSGRDRISVPFFFMGRLDYPVECIATCLEPGEAPKYPPTTPSGHLANMVLKTYGGY
jgi:isopenicillin N synthase-like dioxygenase